MWYKIKKQQFQCNIQNKHSVTGIFVLSWLSKTAAWLFIATVMNMAMLPDKAFADSDGLSPNIETCNGLYNFALNSSGTCDSVNDCNDQRNCPVDDTSCGYHATKKCQETLDFDCDVARDNAEFNNPPTDPTTSSIAHTDHESDNWVDACDPDDDNDGMLDGPDTCPTGDTGWTSNAGTDHDSDGCQDSAEDTDDDNDGILDGPDDCPTGDLGWTSNADTDNDNDGCRDAGEDLDDDNDGDPDVADNCPLVPNPDQAFNDGDGTGDACDNNDDGDANIDTADMCPRTPLSGQPIPANNVDIGCDLICMRPDIGVPGQPEPRIPIIDGIVVGVPPNVDTGWRGAHRVTFGNGTDLAHVAIQALRDKRGDGDAANAFIYLSFEVKNDAGGASAGDTVVVTFRPNFNTAAVSFPAGNANDDIRIIYNVLANTTTVTKYSSGSWTAASPSGLSVVKNPSPAANSWDVEMAIPITITSGGGSWVNFGDYFKFYANVIRDTGGNATEFVWPDHGHRIGGGVLTYAYDNHEWGIGTKDNSAVCHGVYLTAGDITTNNSPNNSVVWPSAVNPTASNTFTANVKNLTWDSSSSNWAVANDINVRFRIADWGIAFVGDLTSTSWLEIPAANDGCDTATSNDNPTCDQNVPTATNSTTPGQQAFNLDWQVSPGDQAKYDPAMGGEDHQCILVEIDSTSGANITTKSVTRNMNFSAAASVFEHKAKIDARGLPKPPGGKTEHTFILQEFRQVLGPIRIKDMKDDVKAASHLTHAVDQGRLPPDAKGSDWLSRTRWLVHGYRETGNFVEIGGVKYPLTEPVNSFGYVISHTGDIVDKWKYKIEGSGIKKTADGVYSIDIPEGGFKEIITRVKSIERNFLQRLIDWLIEYWWLVIILLILFFLWYSRRNP